MHGMKAWAEGKRIMGEYRKQFFDQCLRAIVSELVRAEEKHPDWPDDLAHAAKIVSDQAGGLLSVSADVCSGIERDDARILEEALQTGAMALRFLLNMDPAPRYQMAAMDDWETYEQQAFD